MGKKKEMGIGPAPLSVDRLATFGFADHGSRWKLEDAKARFSDVVRKANSDGPQVVTVRGKAKAVVVSVDDLERLNARQQRRLPFVEFMRGLYVEGLDLARERDVGRDVAL